MKIFCHIVNDLIKYVVMNGMVKILFYVFTIYCAKNEKLFLTLRYDEEKKRNNN